MKCVTASDCSKHTSLANTFCSDPERVPPAPGSSRLFKNVTQIFRLALVLTDVWKELSVSRLRLTGPTGRKLRSAAPPSGRGPCYWWAHLSSCHRGWSLASAGFQGPGSPLPSWWTSLLLRGAHRWKYGIYLANKVIEQIYVRMLRLSATAG